MDVEETSEVDFEGAELELEVGRVLRVCTKMGNGKGKVS